jgi:hypothetical protein
MIEEKQVVCPRCGSELIALLGNEKHCNQCGHSFDLDRSPIATAAQAARERRSPATGWHKDQR